MAAVRNIFSNFNKACQDIYGKLEKVYRWYEFHHHMSKETKIQNKLLSLVDAKIHHIKILCRTITRRSLQIQILSSKIAKGLCTPFRFRSVIIKYTSYSIIKELWLKKKSLSWEFKNIYTVIPTEFLETEKESLFPYV